MPSQCTVSSALLVSGTSANCFCKETWTGPLKLQQSVCPNLLLTYSSLNPNVLLNLKLEYHWRCLIHCELKRQSFVNVLIQKKIIILLNFKEESIYGKITKGALTLKPLKEIGERKSWITSKRNLPGIIPAGWAHIKFALFSYSPSRLSISQQMQRS